ncbi:MAG: hypothetical protein GXP54_07005 [Deltaproteobacteria bacterium]|nr:hypothetical protein [Deltaproteobacteria bacterium]
MTNTSSFPDQGIDLSRPSDSLPLYAALERCYQDGKSGVLTVTHDDTRTPITVLQGRVISVINQTTAAGSVMGLLERSGLIGERDVLRAKKAARKKGLFIEDAVVASGLVSDGTLASTREKLCLEMLMELLIRRDVAVTAVWTVRRGTREMCSLPIPFLLREAQRRATHIPTIQRAVPSNSLVFIKSSSLTGKPGDERWEDLQLSVAERQVYFFVDGRRTVADLALATCQSEFNVAQALHALMELDLVKASPGAGAGSAGTHALRSAVLRLTSLVAALGLLLALTAVALDLRMAEDSPSNRINEFDPFKAVRAAGPVDRLKGAVRLYEMTYGESPDSFEDLLKEHYVLRDDRKAAATFKIGQGYLLKSGPAGSGQASERNAEHPTKGRTEK